MYLLELSSFGDVVIIKLMGDVQQLKKPSLDAVTEDEADKGTWISAACHPEFADGQLRSVMGCRLYLPDYGIFMSNQDL